MCLHKWENGLVIFVENEPKIKTKCIICGEDIIVDFNKGSVFAKEDRSELEDFLRINNRRNI